MRINIKENSVTLADLKSKMVGNFPAYKFKDFGKSMFIASKSSSIGANVVLRKNKIVIAGNFPTLGGRLIFVLGIFLLGVLIPLIVYLIAFLPKFSKFEKELGAFVQKEFGIQP